MCGSTIRNTHGIMIRKSSDMAAIVRVKWYVQFLKKWEIVIRYLSSMRTRYSHDHPDTAYKYRGSSQAI